MDLSLGIAIGFIMVYLLLNVIILYLHDIREILKKLEEGR
jgi:hypothetical protein